MYAHSHRLLPIQFILRHDSTGVLSCVGRCELTISNQSEKETPIKTFTQGRGRFEVNVDKTG